MHIINPTQILLKKFKGSDHEYTTVKIYLMFVNLRKIHTRAISSGWQRPHPAQPSTDHTQYMTARTHNQHTNHAEPRNPATRAQSISPVAMASGTRPQMRPRPPHCWVGSIGPIDHAQVTLGERPVCHFTSLRTERKDNT